MDKNKEKKEYNSYNPTVIKKLKSKYGLTVQFIHQSLRGERNSDTSIKICEDYKIIEAELIKTLDRL